MPYPYHPIAQTSYPTDAQTRDEAGPKSYDDHDFGWDEDWLARFRAIALFGGLLLLEGLVLWWSFGLGPGPHFVGGTLFAFAVTVGLCGIPVTWLSEASEVAMAFFGAGATGVVVALCCPGSTNPTNFSPLPASGSFGVDSALVLGPMAGGGALLVLGVLESVKAARELDREDELPRGALGQPRGGTGQ